MSKEADEIVLVRRTKDSQVVIDEDRLLRQWQALADEDLERSKRICELGVDTLDTVFAALDPVKSRGNPCT